MNNNSTEMMNPQALSNLGLSGNGNARDNFDEALNKEPQRLSRNPAFVKPVKNSVNEQCLKPLGKQPPNQSSDRIICLSKASNVSPNCRPKRRRSVFPD